MRNRIKHCRQKVYDTNDWFPIIILFNTKVCKIVIYLALVKNKNEKEAIRNVDINPFRQRWTSNIIQLQIQKS